MKIRFRVNGGARELESPPLRRLLDILRDDLGLTGAKEGCGEGECGACAVLLDGMLVQSCLVPAIHLPGREVQTIEGRGPETAPDPVQQAFLDEGAVQCGFCIPGMVQATHALLASDPEPTEEAIRAGLSGNICRCTGYERIVRAVRKAAGTRTEASREGAGAGPVVISPRVPVAASLGGTAPRSQPAVPANAAPDPASYAPITLAEALSVLDSHSGTGDCDGLILAGGTDLMVVALDSPIRPRFVLDLSRIQGLSGVHIRGEAIEIGAMTTVAALAQDPRTRRYLPAVATAASLFGAPAIRNRATIGGNLAGASPAADLPPALLALGAVVVLASSAGTREIPLESFVTGYRRTVRRTNELIVAVRVPLPEPDLRQAFFKAGTRRAQSIARASVAGAAQVDAAGTLRAVRLAAGSVAPTPILLSRTMGLIEGRRLDAERIEEAALSAAAEVTPIDDVRSDIAYRRFVTGRLVARFLRGCGGP